MARSRPASDTARRYLRAGFRPAPAREYAADGRVVVPADGSPEDRLAVVLDVLHKRPRGRPPGRYGWKELPRVPAPHSPVAEVRHDLDVPMDLAWLGAHAILPADLLVHARTRRPSIVIEGEGGWAPQAYRIASTFAVDDRDWLAAGWRPGAPWDGTRPRLRSRTDRLLGRPGKTIPPFSSDPDWAGRDAAR